MATYDSPGSTEYAWLHEVHDAYGNSITPTWSSPGTLGSVTQTVADGGSGSRTRTVSFGYSSGSNPSSMTYEGRVWHYYYESSSPWRLTSAQPPGGGPDWEFSYASGVTVTTPTGGTVAYSFTDVSDRSTVHEITTGGRAITSGTWAFAYATSGTTATTTVTTPSSRQIIYAHEWNDGPDGKQWTLTDRTLVDGSTTVQHTARTYQDTTFMSGHPLKALASQAITQDGVTFTTAYHYSGSNFDDYLQPDMITESASNHSATRVVSRTFHTFSSGYILPRVSAETVTMGSASFTRSVDYDTTGFVTEQTAAGVAVEFARDSYGNLATVTDAHDHEITTSYQWGAPNTITTPAATVTHAINSDGSAASETQNGHTTAFSYDDLGRTTAVTPASGDAATTSYASDGSTVTVTRGSSWVTTTVDGFGRPIATENVVGVKTTTDYDNEGRKIFQSAPFTGSSGTGNHFAHDALGRVVTVTHADSTYVTYTYSGTTVAITDENGHTTTQYFQAFGTPGNSRLTSVTDPASHDWAYSYNVYGSLTRVDAPEGPDRVWEYNSANQLTSDTQPESGTTTYTYDGAGLLATKTDAMSRTTTFHYDGNHRLTEMVTPTPTEHVAYEYDAAGNRTRMVTAGLESLFTYDSVNRLTAREDRVNGKVFSTTYGYDDNDNLIQITYPSGRGVHYAYDSGNRITKVCAGSNCSGAKYADNVAYHPTGPISAADFGNGTSESLTLNSRFRPYHLQSGPLDLTYTYFPNGNVDSIDDTRSGYDSSYSYDALDRLTGVSGYGYSSYEYDDLGNRTSKSLSAGSVTYSYNSTTKRLTSASTSMGAPESGTFTYDDVGNMTGDGTETYAYSSRNMMTTSTLTSTSASTRYQYDAEGVRALKSGPSGPSYYIHGPGGLLLAEYAGSFSKESPWAATTGLAPDLRLTWSAVASATYEVCVDQVDDDACNASWVSTSSATYKDLTALPAGTYFWQVRETTTGSPVEADAGHWWSFTVNAEGVFGKTSPGSGATVLTDDVTLAWAALPDVGYYVCWDTTNNNTCDGSWMPNGASTSRLLESLAAGTYYWQVKAWNGSAYTEADAGVWWSFTKVTTASGKLAPTSGTAGLGTDVWLSWAAAGDVAYYVCWDTTDNDTCDDTWHTNGGSTTRLLEGLSAGTYYWQVKVWDGSAYTEMNGGVWWHFTVGAAASPGSGSATVTREYIYLGSRLIAAIESGTTTTYYHQDVLGSVRAITSSAGSTVNRIDYFPFGENSASLSGDPRKFLGQEQDAETAFDYLGARYYRNVWGRFATSDPDHINGNLLDPQSWAAYSYARNNPLKYADPDGTAYVIWNEERKGDSSFTTASDAEWEQALRHPGCTCYVSMSGDYGYVFAWNGSSWELKLEFYHWFEDAPAKNALSKFIGDIAAKAAPAVDAALALGTPNLAVVALSMIPVQGLTGLGELAENGYLNEAIGFAERQLLKDFFRTGRLPTGLSARALRVYRELALRAIEYGKDETMQVQARRLALIDQALRKMGER